MSGGRRYRLNIGEEATPGSKYRSEYVNEDGGNDRDYIDLGYHDKDGNWQDVRGEVIEREGGSIIIVRFKESDKSTVSILLVPGDDKSMDIQGYGLEPKGPSTDEREINQRILPETYFLQPHSGERWKDTFKLSNDQL